MGIPNDCCVEIVAQGHRDIAMREAHRDAANRGKNGLHSARKDMDIPKNGREIEIMVALEV